MLLPEDPQLVAERAISLGQWCQGFLYGLGTNEIPDIDKLPAEVAEIVCDLTAITQVSVDSNESDEEKLKLIATEYVDETDRLGATN